MALDPADGAVLFAAVLAGESDEEAWCLAIEGDGRIVIAGHTQSIDLPSTNGADPCSGANAFVARFSADLTRLEHSVLLCGEGEDRGANLALGVNGSLWVLGYTNSFDFPVTDSAFQAQRPGGKYDLFLTQLDLDAGPTISEQLLYSTYFGGARNEPLEFGDTTEKLWEMGLAADGEGRVYLGGRSDSSDLPTSPGAMDRVLAGDDFSKGFLTVLAPSETGTELVYSTFIGSSPDASGVNDLFLDASGSVWITGATWSATFRTTEDAWDRRFAAPLYGANGFVALVIPDEALTAAEQLRYATFLTGTTAGFQVLRDGDGPVTVAGVSREAHLPASAGAPQQKHGGVQDFFLTRLDPLLPPQEQHLFSTYLGGAIAERPYGLAADTNGRVYLGGFSTSFSIEGIDGLVQGASDGLLASFDLRLPQATFAVTPGPGPGSVQVDAAASATPAGTAIVSYQWDFGDGATAEGVTASHAFAKPGRYALQLAVTNDLGHVATASRLFEFACPSGSVEPWTAADVGSPAFAGGSRLEGPAENSCFSICAGGDDLLSGPSDQFHFVEREFTGDAVLTARVDGFSGGAGAAVGLMFRKDLSAGAAHASILLVNSGGGKYWFLRRELDGQSTKPPTRSAGTFTLPAWIRLERKGGMITGSYSEVDPPAEADWKVLQTIPDFLPGPILAGIAANGKDPGPGSPFVALSATVCLPESPPPAPRFLRGDCNGDRIADLSDAVCILGWLFLGGAKPVCVAAANTNLDGAADISDATYLLSHLFLGGPAPPEPFPDCGPANSPEDLRLGCEDGCR